MYLTRHETAGGPRWALNGGFLPPSFTLDVLLQLPKSATVGFLAAFPKGAPSNGARLLAPVEPTHEVWAAGVTYLRSRDARKAEDYRRRFGGVKAYGDYAATIGDPGVDAVVVAVPPRFHLDLTLQALFERLSLALKQHEIADAPVYYGGPVQTDRGFVLHAPPGDWQSTLRVREAIGLTTSKDILEAVGRGEGPQRMMVTLGYAGWSAGQLEHELSQNAWLTVEARDAIIFDLPAEERLAAAMELLGLDFARLSDEAGHA